MAKDKNENLSPEELLNKLREEIDVDTETHVNRVKASKVWVQHFMYILENVDLKKIDGVQDLENALVDVWESKRDAKDEQLKTMLNALSA